MWTTGPPGTAAHTNRRPAAHGRGDAALSARRARLAPARTGRPARVGSVSKRSALVCAALASAVAPRLRVTGARNLPVPVIADPLIDEAGLVDANGRLLDVLIADSPAMGRLEKRTDNAALIADAVNRARLDIAVDEALAQGRTRDEQDLPVYVVLTRHIDGVPLDFADLTEEECRSLGLAIARIHALDTGFLLTAGHTAYSGAQVRAQLSSWTQGLAVNASVPDAITARWHELLRIDALWDFSPVVSHGDFGPDDILFSADSTVTALRHWERLGLADPASDFAWLFDDGIRQWQRDEVLSGYGEGLGERMDPRIVPRARLWRQLTAVRSLLQALAASDHDRLAQARRTVNAIASALSPVIAVGAGHPVTAVPGTGTGRTATKAERAGATGTTAAGTAGVTRPEGTTRPEGASGIVPSAIPGTGTNDNSATDTGTGEAVSADTGTDTGTRTGPGTGTGADGGPVSDETRESVPVNDGMIDGRSVPGEAGPVSSSSAVSGLSALGEDLVISGDNLRFSGTGSVTRQDRPDIGSHEPHKTREGTDRDRHSEADAPTGTGTAARTGAGTHAGTGTDTGTVIRQSASGTRAAETADRGNDDGARFATNTNMPAIQPDGTRTSLAAVADTRGADTAEQEARDAQTRPFQTQAYIDTDAPDATVRVTHSTSVRERLFPDDPGEELFKPKKNGTGASGDDGDAGQGRGTGRQE